MRFCAALVAAHLFLRHDRGVLGARRGFAHAGGFLHGGAHRSRAHRTDEWCSTFTTPCDCTVEGCGWSSHKSACVAGAATDCLECPNPLICGDETCMMDILDDPQVVAAQEKGEACLKDGNDMAVCLCDPTIGDVMANKLHETGCCNANEVFSQMCYERRCMDVPEPNDQGLRVKEADFCHKISEPCECGIQPGCGWDGDSHSCEPGGATNCNHCAHSMLCSAKDNRCSAQLFKNPDFLETINRAKVCMESGRDTIDVCIEKEGGDLKKFVQDVQINGRERDCCTENKYFKMICEDPPERPKKKDGEGPCAAAGDCEDGLVCEEEVCLKPGAGQGPCAEDGDCRDGLTCDAEGDKCTSPKAPLGEPCESKEDCVKGLSCTDKVCAKHGEGSGPCAEDGDCSEGLTCGDDELCHGAKKADGEGPCAADGDCNEGLACGEDEVCHAPKKKEGEGPCQSSDDCVEGEGLECAEEVCAKAEPHPEGEGPCEEDADCQEGLTCGEDAKCKGLKGSGEGPCSSDADCEEGLGCDGEASVCVAATTTSTSSVFDIMKMIDKMAQDSNLSDAHGEGEGPCHGDDKYCEDGLVCGGNGKCQKPEEEKKAEPTAGDAIKSMNEAAKANHDQTKASIDATNAANEKEIGSRKIPDM